MVRILGLRGLSFLSAMGVLKRVLEFLVRRVALSVTLKSSAQPTLEMMSTEVSGPGFGRAVV
jgi:hypothetical protein